MPNDDTDALKLIGLAGLKAWPRSLCRKQGGAGERGDDGAAAVSVPVLKERPMTPVGQARTGWISPVYEACRPVKVELPALLKNRCIAADASIPEVESFRVLRNLVAQYLEQQGCASRTLMVTSALPREGKTTTAVNLALTLARDLSQTALLVDCDFMQQQVHSMLCYQSDVGLLDYLLYGTPFQEIAVWPGIERLTVISGGKPTHCCREILSSRGMREVLTEMRERYRERSLVLDAPPVLSCADTMALARLVDGIVVVVREGKTARGDVVKAVEMLPKEKVIGIVLNKVPKHA